MKMKIYHFLSPYNIYKKKSAMLLLVLLSFSILNQVQSFSIYSKRFDISKTSSSSLMIMKNTDGLRVMVNGMPGPMALETAIACIDRGIQLAPLGFTGPKTTSKSIEVKVKKIKKYVYYNINIKSSCSDCHLK